MLEIETPKISILESDDAGTHGKFAIDNLERGFGITLGNALRRTLLSSLPGMAVTSIRIEGVQHEFSAINGVTEDTTDLILAMKSLRLKYTGQDRNTNETFHLHIEKEGEGEITAGDILNNTGAIEILNPELHIASLSKEGRLFMEISVALGRGYQSAEHNKYEGMAIGEIPVDSLYSPVLKVNYEVKDKRIGKEADHDYLELEVWTNGALSPEEAVSSAGKLISKHLQLFIGLSSSGAGDVDVVPKEEDKGDAIKEKPLEELDLSVRPYNCLKRAKVDTVGDLVGMTEIEVMKVRNLGKKSLDEIIAKVRELGLQFRNPDEE